MRRLICLFLLICLPLQSFAAQLAGVRLAGAGVAHLVDHARHVHHHHHDDGKVHYDDSDQSIHHTHEASASAQYVLLDAAVLPPVPVIVSLGRLAEPDSFVPNPYLDDPQRPPAFAPGLAAGG